MHWIGHVGQEAAKPPEAATVTGRSERGLLHLGYTLKRRLGCVSGCTTPVRCHRRVHAFAQGAGKSHSPSWVHGIFGGNASSPQRFRLAESVGDEAFSEVFDPLAIWRL